MAAFETMVRFLESLGVFNYLAFVLLITILYYSFEYILRNIKALEKRQTHRMILAVVLSVAVTALMYVIFFPVAGSVGMVVAGIVFISAVFFLLAATGMRLGGMDIPSLFRK
ncbi:MAG: hypothetical protein JW789_03780 [Candidatus Aenigmarchaeota archaeon]|nr:hypothetical protein [Candidatus Aenigmarchaeota archaeon]